MIPAVNQQFPFQTEPFTDKATGGVSRNWWFLLQSLWSRTGQGTGIANQVDDTLTAAGTTQATALQLNKDSNEVTTTPVNSGVQLSDLQPGEMQRVVNAGANALKIYPFAATPAVHIDALANNAAYSLAAGKEQIFTCWTHTHVRSLQLG